MSGKDAEAAIEAVVFDLDGTLLDTEAVHHAAMAAAAEAMGVEWPDALAHAMIGVHRDVNVRRLLDHFGADFAVDRFYDDADARFDAMWRRGIPLRPGARDLLGWLSGLGVPLAIATSTASPFAEERLAFARLDHHFAAVVTRSHVRAPKPDPEPYALAAGRLRVAAARCAAVEDSPNGLRAAAAAGMAALLVPDLVPATAETQALAAAVLPDLAAVQAWLAPRLVKGPERATAGI